MEWSGMKSKLVQEGEGMGGGRRGGGGLWALPQFRSPSMLAKLVDNFTIRYYKLGSAVTAILPPVCAPIGQVKLGSLHICPVMPKP